MVVRIVLIVMLCALAARLASGVGLYGGKINTAGGEISVTGIGGNDISEAMYLVSSASHKASEISTGEKTGR